MRFIRRSVYLLLVLMISGVNAAQGEGLIYSPDRTGKGCILVDFSKHTGVPLFKRQNTFSPSHSFMGDYAAEFVRDAPLLLSLGSQSQRVDLFMGNGGLGGTIGLGTAQKPTYSFMAMDATLRHFYKNGVLPYLVYFATPNALYDKQAAASSYWKYPPVDYEKWADICGTIAAHYREKGWPLAAHEIWNEPDWFDRGTNAMAFYGGTWEEYLKIYEYAVSGIRAADSNAMVGGLSLANFDAYYGNGNVGHFLQNVADKALPLDFISYHCYVPNNYPVYTRMANAALSAFGDAFDAVGLHLNEFHISMAADTTSTEKCVAPMLDAILYFVETPQITSVNWACFRVASEQGIQMIESRTGKRYAAYHVLSLYNRLPVDRVSLTEASGLRGLAGIEGNRAGVLLYNRTYKAKEYSLILDALPFAQGDITVYAIDSEHSNYGRNGGSDEAAVVFAQKGILTADLAYAGTLPSGGAIYVEITKSGAQEDAQPVAALSDVGAVNGDIARVLRREYHFEDRNTTVFSEFDLSSFTAWAGMGSARMGLSIGAAVLDALPERLIARPTLYGNPDAPCFLYAQYLNEAGETIARRLLIRGVEALNGRLPEDAENAIPEVWDASAPCVLETPDGFCGELRLTWGLADAGEDTTLKIVLDKE